MPVMVGAGSSAFEASGSGIKIPATANLSGINTAVGTTYYNTTDDELRIYTGATDGWANTGGGSALRDCIESCSKCQACRVNGVTTNGVYCPQHSRWWAQQIYCMFRSGSAKVEIMDGCLLVVETIIRATLQRIWHHKV